ncbi:alpha/beta hydrolase fold domain-containing protein [Luteolibacter sp. AS25]|uniref:alpha/beta hydrolase fold domain-containing protein n=1 Tax=Luteolibacter sp. AS25 TaxID=3135776 RepID=UPI00398AAF59
MLRTAALLIFATSIISSCSLPSTSASTSYTKTKDITFTPEGYPEPLLADIYKPKTNKPTPAVLLIHGGGWNGKERRSDMTGIAKKLADRGYFVMNTTYRLTPDWKFPAQKEDMDTAISYMRKNSKTLNIDPDRIATFGYSAGGHLAALAGLDPENNVKAIIAGGAPSDLSLWPDGKLTGLLLGGPLKGNEDVYADASPVTKVTKTSPPTFIYHSTGDETVPEEHAKAFAAALEKNNVEHEAYWIDGRSHIMTHLFSAEAIPKAIDFLDKQMK